MTGKRAAHGTVKLVSAPVSDEPIKSAVVFNPTKVDVEHLKSVIRSAASTASTTEAAVWSEPLWLPTTIDDAGQSLTREALDYGARLVVAAGGDGTVRAVAEVLRGTGVALGLIPAGTGNLLARNLFLPLNGYDAPAAIAYSGSERVIDVGVAKVTNGTGAESSHVFLVMAGLGFDASLLANTNPSLKSRVGWLAYVDAGVRSLPKLGKIRVRYAIDDADQRSAHMSTILIANCGSLPGNIELFPDALLDDGQLDIAVMQPKSVFGWLMIWRKVTLENRVLRRTSLGRRYIKLTTGGRETVLTYLRGASVELSVEQPEAFEIDGDDFGSVLSAQLSVDPGSLIVKVPAQSLPSLLRRSIFPA
jgi:diacylglycerol kinase (ATP)